MLPTGTRLGPYEVLSPLGQGGMGEVYRARDTRLDRTVAIKVLPAGRANDLHFRERFEREARAVSSLNHPNICVLHDIGNEGGVAYLVMECLEGESLAARLERGALPVPEALRCAIEIASALDAAHRRGVVHRDLKPGNIMLTKAGAKLLDFGLAKMNALQASAAEHTATITVTTEGSLVGTFQYMSPEQLEGHEADARSDIFAFGATLYEMLTGRRAFTATSQASLIAGIMSAQPAPASSVQAAVPPPLDRVVRRCLAKSPDDRWQTARDLAEELRWIQEGGAQTPAALPAPPAKSRPLLLWIATIVCALAAVAFGVALLRQEKPAPPRPMWFSVNAPEGAIIADGSRPAISPDGQFILFIAVSGGKAQVYLHSLASGTTRAVAGIDPGTLYWSFDSRSFLVRSGGNRFVKGTVSGEPPQILEVPFVATYCSWGPGGILNASGTEVRWVAADGSAHRTLHSSPKAVLSYVSWLPGGQSLLYNEATSGPAPNTNSLVHALSIDGKTTRVLGKTGGPAIYAAPGYLLFQRGSVLVAQALDWKRLELTGGPTPVTDHIAPVVSGSLGAFSVSDTGVLAFKTASVQADTRLTWFDRSGSPLGEVAEPADYSNPALSPDGTRLAVGIRNPATQSRDIWVIDLVRNSSSKLTFDPADDLNPAWSPDGSRIAFTSDRKGVRSLYTKNSMGTGEDELLAEFGIAANVEDWSRDGRWIVFNGGTPAQGLHVISPETHQSHPFLENRSGTSQARFSPDGHWLAYTSTEAGRQEVFVRPFQPNAPEGSGGRWQISTHGGSEPQWRADGKEMYFLSQPPYRIMAVDIEQKGGAIVAGIPHELFPVRLANGGRNRYVVAPDGKKFLVLQVPEQKPATTFNVILNWPSLLKK